MLLQYVFCLHYFLVNSQELKHVQITEQRDTQNKCDKSCQSINAYQRDSNSQDCSEYFFEIEEDIRDLFLGVFGIGGECFFEEANIFCHQYFNIILIKLAFSHFFILFLLVCFLICFHKTHYNLLTRLHFIMNQDRLTDNGIDKLVGSIGSVVVQVLAIIEKCKNNQKFYGCQLSDGFCKLKGCLIVDQQIYTENKLIRENIVIKVMKSAIQQNKLQQPIVIVENYKVFNDKVNWRIGEPMYYDEFIKKGKQNSKGSNTFERLPPQKKNIQKRNYEDLMEETKQEEQTQQINKSNTMGNFPKGNQKGKIENSRVDQKAPVVGKANNSASNSLGRNGNLRLSNQEQDNKNRINKNDSRINDQSSNTFNKQNNMKVNQPNQNNRQTKDSTSKQSNFNEASRSNSSLPKNQNRNRGVGPIQKVNDNKRAEPIAKGNQKRPVNEYNEIRSLFVGMENWVILARVLFVNPIKNFINKKGAQSSLLNIDIGDCSGTIECTMFGEIAQRFEGKFKQDQLYEIANGTINESNYLGKHELRVNINENTRVSIKQDDSSVPFTQDFCKTIKQLLEAPIGSTLIVVCLIRDTQQPENLVSKAGKEMRKKQIYLCDPQQKVEAQVTLWNERCEQTFQTQPYIIKGVIVTEYRGNRQYSLKTNYMARIIKHHNYRKFIKEFDHMTFANPDSQKKKRGNICNFKELNGLMDDINSKGVWSDIICSLSSLKNSFKNYYLACPHCKKKVLDETNGECAKCNKTYQESLPRYILNLSLCDNYDSIWATAYDEAAEIIMGITATQFAAMKEEQLQELIKKLRYKEFKLRLVTNNEEYNGQTRKKTGIIKVLNLSYAQEARSILSKLQYLLKE